MAKNNACTVPAFKWNLQGIVIRYFAVFIFVFLLFPERISAQDEPEYDEITVFFSVPRIGGANGNLGGLD